MRQVHIDRALEEMRKDLTLGYAYFGLAGDSAAYMQQLVAHAEDSDLPKLEIWAKLKKGEVLKAFHEAMQLRAAVDSASRAG